MSSRLLPFFVRRPDGSFRPLTKHPSPSPLCSPAANAPQVRGVIITDTKGTIGIFRVVRTGGSTVERSIHMSVWMKDGSAIIAINLHGKMIERINVSCRCH